MADDSDLYEVLGVHRTATTVEIKKAYHKAALSSHPDKFPPEERDEAEVRFKIVSQAYEILSDDSKRRDYDTYGMDAFNPRGSGGGGAGMSEEDFFQDFFGGGGGGGSGFRYRSAPSPPPRSSRRTEDALQTLPIALKFLYKGKTQKMSIERNIICATCKGTGAKSRAKPHKCAKCSGHGVVEGLRPIGNGLAIPIMTRCPICSGRGEIVNNKDKCKKCHGDRVVSESKILEVYVPPGSKEGDKIVFKGEADQEPGKETGSIIFTVHELPDPVFQRAGADLRATVKITLVEALCGFSRPVLDQLDGRALQVTVAPGTVVRPGDILLIRGEGMPIKGALHHSRRGDLYLDIEIEFPRDNWFLEHGELRKLEDLLSFPARETTATEAPDKKGHGSSAVVDDVEFKITRSAAEFGLNDGLGSGNGGEENDWEDEDTQEGGCRTQ
ncbi:uncharacterized protein V1518DRAFT_418986 [Limtongia smithiae]|uniref:uncharacterized protein n=1 Tax=Limtongia smithiae TaxID=1125753 RepID=UPI0034CD2C8B